MSAHAALAPSSAKTWLACSASIALTFDAPDVSSEYADEGTLAHALAAHCLEHGVDPEFVHTVDDKPIPADMVAPIQGYVDTIRALGALALVSGGDMLVEQRVDITGAVPECFGTADVIIAHGAELQVHDLKYGYAPVSATENVQLMLYALGALDLLSLAVDFDTVRLFIHQPRNGGTSEHVCTVDELLEFGAKARNYAELAIAWRDRCAELDFEQRLAIIPAEAFAPSADVCQYCRVKAKCPAVAKYVADQVGDIEAVTEPDANTPADELGRNMRAVALIEDWCKAVRAEAERRLLAGQAVPGFKLVQGRRGARAWADEKEVLEAVKAMRLKHDEIYDYSLASPTSLERLLKPSPRRWARLAPLVTQRDGKPSVAPETDKRPALVVAAAIEPIDDLTNKEV